MTGEAVVFWILAPLTVIAALGVVASAKAVYSALFLASTMVMLAVFYIVQGAVFLGVVQIVVYTGAVMMLFLFVLMLVGVDTSDTLTENLRGHRVAAAVSATHAPMWRTSASSASIPETRAATACSYPWFWSVHVVCCFASRIALVAYAWSRSCVSGQAPTTVCQSRYSVAPSSSSLR